MFAVGTDTSFVVLEWAVTELLRNPEAMKKLRDEVQHISGGKSIIREEDLSEMSYLKSVIKEVLRLHPPTALLLPRDLMEECEIQGYKIFCSKELNKQYCQSHRLQQASSSSHLIRHHFPMVLTCSWYH